MTVKLGNVICVTEIKVTDGGETGVKEKTPVTNSALEQIKARGYAEKYRGESDVLVFEVGMVFDPAARTLASFAWRELWK